MWTRMRDDAGVEGKIVTRIDRSSLSSEQYREVIRAMAPRVFLWAFVFEGVAIAFVIVVMAFQRPKVSTHVQHLLVMGPMALAMLAILIGTATMVVYGVTGRRQRNVRAVWLGMNRCPFCAYDLSGCSADSDGLTRCPECSARWRR